MSKEYNSSAILKHIENGFLEMERSIGHASMIKIVPIDVLAEEEPLYLTLSDDDEKAIQKAIIALVERKRRRITNLVPEQESKVFREHRGGLSESLETTIECPNGLEDIKRHYEKYDFTKNFLSDIQITKTFIPDDRLPAVWKGGSYNVMGKFKDCDVYAVIGQCNFRE